MLPFSEGWAQLPAANCSTQIDRGLAAFVDSQLLSRFDKRGQSIPILRCCDFEYQHEAPVLMLRF